jgi:hypothetical protein
VISNHVSWTDFYMIQALAIRAGMLSRCRWFAKIELRWVPLLGWAIWAMGMPMVTRKWLEDQKELDRVFAGIVVRKWPTCKLDASHSHALHLLIIFRVDQFQRGHSIHSEEVRRFQNMVQSKQSTDPKASPLSKIERLCDNSPTIEASEACQSCIRYDNRIRT